MCVVLLYLNIYLQLTFIVVFSNRIKCTLMKSILVCGIRKPIPSVSIGFYKGLKFKEDRLTQFAYQFIDFATCI